MNINLKTIAFMGLMTMYLVSCKNNRNENEGNDPLDNSPMMEQDGRNNDTLHTHVPDSDTTNISPDSTQAEPPAITRP